MSTPSIYPIVPYRDLRGALTFLCDAFGFTPHLRVEDASGVIQHVELALGDGGVIMPFRSDDPAPMWLCVRVGDIDAHYAQAVEAGVRIADELHDTPYGRDYSALDPAGHRWTFTTYDPYAPSSAG